MQDNRKHLPPLDVGPSLARIASPSGRGNTHTSLLVGVTPGAKHRQLACQLGVLHVFHQLPISFQMATLVSPIPRSTVIWFGSLEFMSTGTGYDMILLLVKGPGGTRVAPARSKALRRPRHHASPPKKRRGQHRHHPSAASRSSTRARRAVAQQPAAPRAEATNMMARRRDGPATTLGDDATRVLSTSTTLLPHGLFASRGKHSFSLDNAAVSLARTICPDGQTYVERQMVLLCDAEAQQQVAELLDFSRVRSLRRLGPGRHTITSLR